MADLKAFAEQLVNLTVKEVNELATILKDEYGIEPAAAAAPVAVAAAGALMPVKQLWQKKLNLTSFLSQPALRNLKVVKTVKELTGLGLKEAKELVDGLRNQ
jgi:large subunit ribosomal protein L7/L12